MLFRDLDLPDSLKDALEAKGFKEMYPHQADAIPKALEGKNLVVTVPTAGGKSMIGFIPALRMVLQRGKRVLYIVPLKALASEKRDDLDELCQMTDPYGKRCIERNVQVVMTTGDPDRDDDISDADIVIATSEKADSMLRHGNTWIRELGMVIADEVHMIHDPGRGPTLEIALTKLMRNLPKLQIIALSATVSNSLDLAMWLKAELVKSNWRPTKLKEGVYLEEEICFNDNSKVEVPKETEPLWGMVKQTVTEGGQCLIFVNSRRSTESVASKLSERMKKMSGRHLSEADRVMLEGSTESTSVGKKLAECVAGGVAFHHAGLEYKQRRCVEDGFRRRDIKCIVATPTLAAGINLPARRVIVRDTSRFESNAGNVPLPVMEIKQMCGRAGRPGYDPWGEAVLVAKSQEDKDHLFDDYIMADTERLTSKLGNEKALRGHILGLIATGDVATEGEIKDFMEMTFFGSTCELYGIERVISNVVDFLVEYEMVERTGDYLNILPFGKRVSDMYIDPWTAVILKKAVLKMDENTDELMIMQALACTPDVMGMYPKKDDIEELESTDTEYDGRWLCTMEDEMQGDDNYDAGWENHLADLKTALLLMRWISEMSEDAITEVLKIGPGDIRQRVDSADWILYAMNEIALIFNPDASNMLKPLLVRVRYGVKEELVPLVKFRGVARTRARTLFNAGIVGRQEILDADVDMLANLHKIGKALANSLKEQAGYVSRTFVEPVETTEDDEINYMLERMAAEEEAKNNPAPIAEERPKKASKGKEPSKSQKSLFDF